MPYDTCKECGRSLAVKECCVDCSWKNKVRVDPITEEKARTLERITAMLPEECHIECSDYTYGYNDYRSEVIALLPQIIAEAERRERERILGIIEEVDPARDPNPHYWGVTLRKRIDELK